MSRQEASQSVTTRAPLLDVNGVAFQLGISRDTVYRLVAGGELRPFRVAHHLRFSPEELDEYLEGHREGQPAGAAPDPDNQAQRA